MSKSDCLGFKFRFSVTVLNYFKINKSHYLNTLTFIFMLCNQYTHADDAAEDCKCTPTSTSTDLRTALVKGRDTKTPKSKSWKMEKWTRVRTRVLQPTGLTFTLPTSANSFHIFHVIFYYIFTILLLLHLCE